MDNRAARKVRAMLCVQPGVKFTVQQVRDQAIKKGLIPQNTEVEEITTKIVLPMVACDQARQVGNRIFKEVKTLFKVII